MSGFSQLLRDLGDAFSKMKDNLNLEVNIKGDDVKTSIASKSGGTRFEYESKGEDKPSITLVSKSPEKAKENPPLPDAESDVEDQE